MISKAAFLTPWIVLCATNPAASKISMPLTVASGDPPLTCIAGPMKRQYGGSQWLVYGCDDAKSLAVVAAAGNPANPFYFMLYPRGGAYVVVGEGQGNRSASQAAGEALRRLTSAQIMQLSAEAHAKWGL